MATPLWLQLRNSGQVSPQEILKATGTLSSSECAHVQVLNIITKLDIIIAPPLCGLWTLSREYPQTAVIFYSHQQDNLEGRSDLARKLGSIVLGEIGTHFELDVFQNTPNAYLDFAVDLLVPRRQFFVKYERLKHDLKTLAREVSHEFFVPPHYTQNLLYRSQQDGFIW